VPGCGSLLGISTLPRAGRKRSLSNASTVVKNQTFVAGVTKNINSLITFKRFMESIKGFTKIILISVIKPKLK